MMSSSGIVRITVMKYVDEFRNPTVAAALAERIKKTERRPWRYATIAFPREKETDDSALDKQKPTDLPLLPAFSDQP